MLGIIVTLFAVFAAICFAFCYSEHPSSRKGKQDVLFYLAPKYFKRSADSIDRKNPKDSGHIYHRQS